MEELAIGLSHATRSRQKVVNKNDLWQSQIAALLFRPSPTLVCHSEQLCLL